MQMHKSVDDSADVGTLVFYGMTQEDISKAALSANKNLQFRWGNGTNMSIPHEYVVHAVDVKYHGDASTVTLHLIDNRVHMMANSGFTAFPHKSFSEIVSAVAKSFSHLPAAVVQADKYVTEVLQTGCSHWAFLTALKREGAQAASTLASDFNLYFKGGNELHFHPPDYTQSAYRHIDLFGGALTSELNMRNAPWKPLLAGSTAYKASAFLPNESKPYTKTAKSSTAFQGEPSLGNRVTATVAKTSSLVGAFAGKFFRSMHNASTLVERDANIGTKQAFANGDSMEFTTEGDPAAEPGSIVSLGYKDRYTGQPLEPNANWFIKEVYHDLSGDVAGLTKMVVARVAG